MSAADIALALGDARREGHSWRCRCPVHGGRSLVLRDGYADRLLVKCWSGCITGEVLAELRRLGLVGHRAKDYRAPAVTRRDDAARTARALRIWHEARPIQGTLV